jgi:hypothetical protein
MTLTAIGIIHGYSGRVGLVTRPIHLVCDYIHAAAIRIIAAFAVVAAVAGVVVVVGINGL